MYIDLNGDSALNTAKYDYSYLFADVSNGRLSNMMKDLN